MCMCVSHLLSQHSQFVLHHHVWLAHHFTLGWICKVTGHRRSVAVRYYIQTVVTV